MTASPVADSGPWSLGTLIGLPLGVLAVAALAVVGVLLIRSSRSRVGRVDTDVFVFGIGSLVVAALVAIATFAAMWPYGSEFHQWRDVSGTVERVESRQIADGDGMSERYVFVIEGQSFSVDDTRAAVAEKGDTVSLRCKREWQYAASSGWACRWSGADQP